MSALTPEETKALDALFERGRQMVRGVYEHVAGHISLDSASRPDCIAYLLMADLVGKSAIATMYAAGFSPAEILALLNESTRRSEILRSEERADFLLGTKGANKNKA
jgi:hypothetical protein